MNEDEARAEYADLLPRLRDLRASIVAGLRRLESDGAEIRSRIKAWESVREKLSRSNQQNVADIQDLLGIRIVVPDVQSFLDASEILRSDFGLPSQTTQHVRFGESAAHFVVRAGSNPVLAAEIQVLTAAEEARRFLEHESRYRIAIGEPLPRPSEDAALKKLADTLSQFESLIELSDVHEKRDVHRFLEANDFLLFPNPDAVMSEVPIGLGTEFRIDFVVQRPDGSYLLIELENPRAELFTKSGEFSAGVNHALRQVEDWQEWIEANLPTVERSYP